MFPWVPLKPDQDVSKRTATILAKYPNNKMHTWMFCNILNICFFKNKNFIHSDSMVCTMYHMTSDSKDKEL